jgi:hypothetical protein
VGTNVAQIVSLLAPKGAAQWRRLLSLVVRFIAPACAASSLLAAAPSVAQTCGALGSPSSIGGCVAPGQYGAPSVRLKSDPLNPGGYRAYPVSPSPSYPANLPPGMNRDYSRPNVPGLY